MDNFYFLSIAVGFSQLNAKSKYYWALAASTFIYYIYYF